MRNLLLCFAVVFFCTRGSAQIPVVASGATGDQVNLAGAYTQNFDALLSTGSSGTFPTAWKTSSGFYSSNNGYTQPLTVGSYGMSGSRDRALGSGTAASFGVALLNATDFTLSGVEVAFDGEQWARGANVPQKTDTLFFSYQIFDAGAGSITVATGWTPVTELDFISPNAIAEAGAALLDGNLFDNSVRGIADSFTGFTLRPGQELWLRWTARNDAINDHSLAIDNLRVSFAPVPESAATALVFGCVGLGPVLLARRRRPACDGPSR